MVLPLESLLRQCTKVIRNEWPLTLAKSHGDKTVLHQLLDPELHDHPGIAFGRLKPLLCFLLTISLGIPTIRSKEACVR